MSDKKAVIELNEVEFDTLLSISELAYTAATMFGCGSAYHTVRALYDKLSKTPLPWLGDDEDEG